MRFTYNWLKNYLSTELSANQIAEKLTSIGLEVESFEDPSVVFDKFKLAQIESTEKHPNADRLKVCEVIDSDGKKYHIVCGAPNARAGLKTILALPGAFIPGSGVILKKSKIRGIDSEGMMCSRDELALPDASDGHGIIEIDPETDLSASIGEILGYDGGIFDISITPNRGDCFSVKGIARDLVAAGAGTLIESEQVACKCAFDFPLNIHKEYGIHNYAPFIALRVIRGIKNGSQLKEAIHFSKLIIVTTIQKFLYTYQNIMNITTNKKYAVIIDEAHSSQTGTTSLKVRKGLSSSFFDQLLETIERKKPENITFFAFTATPKKETLQLFGIKNSDGKYEPFHIYSMKQAIEEKFIVDVLKNYITYKSYYQIGKLLNSSSLFDVKPSLAYLKNYSETHEQTIQKKSEVIINHFIKIKNNYKQSKAMIITETKEMAYQYFKSI